MEWKQHTFMWVTSLKKRATCCGTADDDDEDACAYATAAYEVSIKNEKCFMCNYNFWRWNVFLFCLGCLEGSRGKLMSVCPCGGWLTWFLVDRKNDSHLPLLSLAN